MLLAALDGMIRASGRNGRAGSTRHSVEKHRAMARATGRITRSRIATFSR